MSELGGLLHQLEEQYGREQAQLAVRQANVQNLRQQIQLLKQLIALRDGQGDSNQSGVDPSLTTSATKATLSELVRDILDAHGQPMHIAMIRGALIAQGHSIPGRGTDANVIAHISRNDSIVRVGKGMYALASWGLTTMPKRKRRATRRRVEGHASAHRERRA